MPRRALALIGLGVAASMAVAAAQAPPPAIRLPNDWTIAPPGGPVTPTGTLPQGVTLSRDGSRAFVVDAGYAPPGLRIFDTKTLALLARVPLRDAFGSALRDAGSDNVWVAGASTNAIVHIDTAAGRIDRTVSLGNDFYAASIARSPDGTTLAVTGDSAGRVAFVDANDGHVSAVWGTGAHPKATAFSPDGALAFVADWDGRTLDVVDPRKGAVDIIAVGLHPAALASDAQRLYVADADDDDITVVDIAAKRAIARVPLGLNPLVGASPNALTLDGDRLYVSCGAANAIVVLHVDANGLTPLGVIPTGWYPTGVAVDRMAGALYVTNGKGEGGHANGDYAPFARVHAGDARAGYIAGNLVGSLRRLTIPTDAQLAAERTAVAKLGAPFARTQTASDAVVRAGGPIKHIIYVIKENRTYDQVLGDLAQADGDAALVMFGRRVTPNEHALAERFGVFDRFFDNAHVSADGHNWSTAAFANDYLEKMWPPVYAGRRTLYDFEDGAHASVPHAGYLWDLAARSGVTFRNYGEFTSAGALKGGDVTTDMPNLRDRTDLHFPTFDMDIGDVDRLREWRREFDAFERAGTLPQLEIVRLPRDHTAGTRPGSVTPQGMVADNDLAVGRLAEIVSHSRDWSDSAIFVVEDDAQNGGDHVDEQRSTFYLISPYAAGGVQHLTFTTAGVLRTIETILGMPPLTPYDAGARRLDAAFRARPDLRPFDALAAETDTQAVNAASAYRARDSARLDFWHADAVPDGVLNDILWHAVKGNAPAPAAGELREPRRLHNQL
jgi:YVTN family beta-propeller protein